MQSETKSAINPRIIGRLKIILVLLLALIQGLIHFSLLPPWQHYDEPTHFEYVWLIANRGELPEENTIDHQMRREAVSSMIEHDFFWNLTPPDLLSDQKRIWLGHSELVHPPAYYVLSSIPVYFARHLDFATQLYAARTTSLLMFLLIIGVTIGLMRDIVPRHHPLRWLVPLTVLLLPPFASHMTAVNNDVGAVLIFSLFLWGAVRLIRYGLSWERLLWVIGAASFTIMTKNTAALALLMLPIALIIAIWTQYKWSWRLFIVGVTVFASLLLVSVLDTGDAAYWHRDELHNPQVSTIRDQSPLVPSEHVLKLEINPTDGGRKWLNPLLPEQVEQIKGQTVTIGGWLWADESVEVLSPGLMISLKGETSLNKLTEAIEITSTPTFLARTYEIPDETAVAYYAFWGQNLSKKSVPFPIYLDHAFVVTGDHSEMTANPPDTMSLPSIIQENNLIRNPSAEQTWLRLRPWIHSLIAPLLRRPPSYIFNALEDIEKSGPILFGQVAPFLLYDFFSAFAWGHVRLGVEWISFFYFIIAITLMGSLKWLIQHKEQTDQPQYPLLFFLTLTSITILAATLLWPLPYQWARMPLPSGRYLYTSIIPLALILAGSWWALWPKRYRYIGILLWVAVLLLLNAVSINTISSFYSSLPVT